MRMFVAVRPPEQVLAALADYLEPRREAGGPLRWARPEQWHITLAFLPSVADRQLDELLERLTETAAHHSSFSLQLKGSGTFPNPAEAKVLWAGVAGDLAPLAGLVTTVRSACGRSGVVVEGGGFRPHLTLARMNRPTEATRWLRVFELYAGPAWQVGEIGLLESQLGNGPARHRLLADFPLG